MTFSILDLGSHDGYIAEWLGRQLQERGVDVQIDGIELNSHAVNLAKNRLAKHGISGSVVQGLAEDAYEYFDLRSYDAVVAFELIEHVPDMAQFLSTCEDMLKPGGRIYISTPDGTFGAGQNPHHLRALRSVDLYNICRRRGQVQNMVVGADTVSVIAYTPDYERHNGPRTAIYCGPGWEAWAPTDIETKGLGGSETAAIRLAEHLSDLGHTVSVYGECEQFLYRQVEFRHHTVFDPMGDFDYVIVSRIPQILDRRFHAKKVVLWLHDVDAGPAFTREHADKLHSVVVLSEWHENHVREVYPWLDRHKIRRFYNGVEPSYFPIDKMPVTRERPHRAIYSSSPDRGLDVLLRLWPKVREQVPDAELVTCYASVYNAVAQRDPALAGWRRGVDNMMNQPGVINLGALPQQDLIKVMAGCRAWLHPSWMTRFGQPFHETFCIGALEAAGAGCILIMAGWGALGERVAQAHAVTTINTPPDSDTYEDEWVTAIVTAMTQDDFDNDPSLAAINTTWRGVAERFHGILS